MVQAAEALEPKVVKISSKRQITIPAEFYDKKGFADYALVTWTEKGLEIQPLPVDDEDVEVKLLASLVEQGLEGDELVQKFAEAKRKVVSFKASLLQAENDIAEGRVYPVSEMMNRLANKYGK